MDQRETFRALHEKTFIMPNPWDRGSTKILASLGFPALATRISIGSAIAAAAQAAIVEAGRELLDSGTHTFWTKAIAHMGTVMGAMSAKGK